ncbi:unnamed protein product, partial [Polarella glacialis]
AGDTRTRLFGVEPGQGTWNATTRAMSFGRAGHHPKGEYAPPRQTVASHETLAAEAAWPQSVMGGFVIPFQGSEQGTRPENLLPAERTRRTGSLGRNIVGNCTVKDEGRFVYYGAHGSTHYGNNSGTRTTGAYKLARP